MALGPFQLQGLKFILWLNVQYNWRLVAGHRSLNALISAV